MQYAYRSVCLMPVLADSVVVVDEVHSFDRSLFSSLKRFLREFDIPVLCMTASLPAQRQRDLVDCGLKVFPDDLREFADLQNIALLPRYKVCVLDGQNSARVMALARSPRENASFGWSTRLSVANAWPGNW